MVLQLGLSLLKGVTLFAGAMPGMEFITDAIDVGVADNTPFNDLVDSIQQLNHTAGDVSADIGNAIGLDNYLAVGENALRGQDFYEGMGIIPTTIAKTAGYIPQLSEAVMENPLPAIGGGAAVLALTSLDPSLPIGIHDGSSRAAKNIVTIANQASQHAQTTYQTASNTAHNVGVAAHNVGAGLHTAAETVQTGVKAVGTGLQKTGQFLTGESNGHPAAQTPPVQSYQEAANSIIPFERKSEGRVANAPHRIIGAGVGAPA